MLKLIPYELFKGRKPNITHLKVFGCKCFSLNNGKSNLGKFDSKASEGIFLGYSLTNKAYKFFNKHTLIVEESIHVAFDESFDNVTNTMLPKESLNAGEPDTNVEQYIEDTQEAQTPIETKIKMNVDLPKDWITSKELSKSNIIGDITKGVSTRRQLGQF